MKPNAITQPVGTDLEPTPAGPAVTPLDLPVETFRGALERRKANRQALMEWIRGALVDGIDFGRIHSMGKSRCPYAAQGRARACPDPRHWSKPSLFKPGAEKICGMLGVTVHYPSLKDYEQAALGGVDLHAVILRCELRDAGGRVMADGVGARSLQQDNGDLNKALKMASKSAHVDATLRMAWLSEVFTQDVEDMASQEAQGSPLEAKPAAPVAKEKKEDLEKVAERLFSDPAAQGTDALATAWNRLDKAMKHRLQPYKDRYKAIAAQADEAQAEREAIQAEAEDAEARRQKAQALLDQARRLRQAAEYADGQAHYRDKAEAQRLENEARKLLGR